MPRMTEGRTHTDEEIVTWWRDHYFPNDTAKMRCIMELNPSLKKPYIVGVLEKAGIVQKSREYRGRRRFTTTEEQRKELREQYAEWSKLKKGNRETIHSWRKRIGISYTTFYAIVTSTEEEYLNNLNRDLIERVNG